MQNDYLPAPGEVISKDELCNPWIKDLFVAIENMPEFQLLECRRLSVRPSEEAVIFEVKVSVGQITKNPILKKERVAVVFDHKKQQLPEVLALRSDFPKLSHINLRDKEFPRSLCILDETYEEFALKWTPSTFLIRIQEWLEKAAQGSLHADDQQLEPFLQHAGYLISDVEIQDILLSETDNLVVAYPFEYAEDLYTFIVKETNSQDAPPSEIVYCPFEIRTNPTKHGIINRAPSTLNDLCEILLSTGIDLVSELQNKLQRLAKLGRAESIKQHRMILKVKVPLKRYDEMPEETSQSYFFLVISHTIKDLGILLNVWKVFGDRLGLLFDSGLSSSDRDSLNSVKIIPVSHPSPFSQELAIEMSGTTRTFNGKVVLIGVGALGSQVFMNVVRMGMNNWTIIDNDCFLPHNISRHALTKCFAGRSKASSIEMLSKDIFGNSSNIESITADVLNPKSQHDNVTSCLKAADVIIDASTTIPVARKLALDIDSRARRVSIFISPSGSDSVFLCEDRSRCICLDCLEMQYYRLLIREKELFDHLRPQAGDIYYSGSCRDVSFIMPQDLVAIHSGICSRAISESTTKDSACISIWKFNPDDYSVTNYTTSPSPTLEFSANNWKIITDEALLESVHMFRNEKLPKETGGVLIGAFDMTRKIIYVVDMIRSPQDSQEYPHTYIRGHRDLERREQEIRRITRNNLRYIGEWHSHPDGRGTYPSGADKEFLAWIKEDMGKDGLPGLMMIVGDSRQYSFHIAK